MSLDAIRIGLLNTVWIWCGAMAIGALCGALLCAMRMHSNVVFRGFSASLITVVRGVPPLMWIFIIFFTFRPSSGGLSPIAAATVALGLVASAYLAEIFRSGLEAVPKGQVEAARALALPPMTVLSGIRGPQALPLIVASSTSYSINLMKDTALASLIGASELTLFASDEVSRGGDGMMIFLLAGLLYLVISVPVGVLGRLWTQRAQLAVSGP